MQDVWCSRLDFFCKISTLKYPIWVISDIFSDFPKLIPGGSRMYTISCKASKVIYKKISLPCYNFAIAYSQDNSFFTHLTRIIQIKYNHTVQKFSIKRAKSEQKNQSIIHLRKDKFAYDNSNFLF